MHYKDNCKIKLNKQLNKYIFNGYEYDGLNVKTYNETIKLILRLLVHFMDDGKGKKMTKK